MSKINILDKSVAELIAAGEVIERPASIVKELIENSIDSGATQITIEIKKGGITFIRVIDNGCGIESDDVEKAFLRHATSKILKSDDLDKILTLGFRGEALASISAVSNTEIITKTVSESSGTRVVLKGYEVVEKNEVGCKTGTTITISDLFYNTPARMKFLKKDITEANAVSAFVEKLALSNPQISFKFIRDGKMTINTPGDNNSFNCIYTVLGKDFANSLIPVNFNDSGVSINGFISKPQSAKGNRSSQHFFVNGRYIRSKTLMSALEAAYKNSIMVSKYPSCVLFVEFSPEFCDINVHPQKLEVRFADEKLAFHSLYYGAQQALFNFNNPQHLIKTNSDNFKNEQSFYTEKNNNTGTKAYIDRVKSQFGFDNNLESETIKSTNNLDNRKDISLNQSSNNDINQNICFLDNSIIQKDNCTSEMFFSPSSNNYTQNQKNDFLITYDEKVEIETVQSKNSISEKCDFKVIGELFKTYILIEKDKKLILIDKHAAHERIIFERLKMRNDIVPQILLSPVIVNLSREEFCVLIENKSEIENKCFSFDEFGDNAIIIREIPSIISEKDIVSTISEIAGNLIKNQFDKSYSKLDWIYHSIACRAAIKANDNTSLSEMKSLANDVFTIENIKFCPHGRPVLIEIEKMKIEKLFGRIG